MATVLTFRDTIARITPPWLSGFWGSRLLYAMALQMDLLAETTVLAVRARFPTGEIAGQLPRIGRDRAIRRGIFESNAAYARRLQGWLDVRRVATTAFGLLDQLAALLAPHALKMRVVNDSGDWYTRNADGSREFVSVPGSWPWDSARPSTRFWVILYAPATLWVNDATWADPGAWGDGGTIGSTATPEQVEAVRNTIRDCRAAHTLCQNIIVAFDGSALIPAGAADPDGHWDLWSHRNSQYVYWDGV
jgi:hypothetical protein